MQSFKVWEDDGATEADASTVEALDAHDAAEEYAERMFPHSDYPRFFEKIVVKDAAGVVTNWYVEVEAVPHFHASPIK